SGSTGRPKGVGIEHRSATALIHWARGVFPPEDLAGVLAATSIAFDLSVFEIFVPLSWGGAVILAANALELPALPAAAAVTLVNTVPSAMAELVRGGLPAGVRTVNLAGEPLSGSLAAAVHGLGTVRRLLNLYGPTEDTTYSTIADVKPGESREPTIGRPVAGTRAVLLDRRGELVPRGVPGELHLGGDGLARGYLGRPDLTAERFVPDGVSAVSGRPDRPGARLYRTGDLARLVATRELDYLGRIDHQVKIRGYRIELGEIEAALRALPGVREAAVLVRADGGERRLVGYVVPEAPATPPALEAGGLRSALAGRLPEPMIPAAFEVLAALPMTSNGKVDRNALARRLPPDVVTHSAAAPRNAAEEVLAGIFAEVLGLDAVGIDDDFFTLGGHSLLASRVASRVRRAFGVEIPLRRLFEQPTVSRLAVSLSEVPAAGRPALRREPRDGDLPLSFGQERLWFLEQLGSGNAAYNVPQAVRLQGRLEVAVLAGALAGIVRRHETLRTTFAASEAGPVQRVSAAAAVPLPVVDLIDLGEAAREETARRLIREEA